MLLSTCTPYFRFDYLCNKIRKQWNLTRIASGPITRDKNNSTGPTKPKSFSGVQRTAVNCAATLRRKELLHQIKYAS
jgi:hypothetical protein